MTDVSVEACFEPTHVLNCCSLHPNGTTDPTSLHGSCPTLKGEKWSATKWIHGGPTSLHFCSLLRLCCSLAAGCGPGVYLALKGLAGLLCSRGWRLWPSMGCMAALLSARQPRLQGPLQSGGPVAAVPGYCPAMEVP